MTGQRKALIVANDEYEQEALRNLLAPGADAEALGRVLGDPQIGEFSVQVVRNEPSYVIQAQIEELFSESRPDDVVLIHFSGHGLKSESGELYFAASNTRPNRLGSTAVSADFVQRCMRDSRSRSIVVLLDCCYGGAFAQGVTVRAAGNINVLDSFPQGRQGGGRGRAVITASNAMEYAFEGDQLADDRRRRPSVFTSALVEGLATGEADRDEDGWVSLSELYDYVFDKVREENPHQTPSRQFELEGELYLARSRRLRIRPAPLPPDLQAALADPNMYTRLGAVSELRSRLLSDDLPVAAGAYQALADLARNDIRTVAEPAAAAVSEAVVRPEETELHFGRIEQGSAPPHRMVRLLGPPIARACAPRASDDWIRVADRAGGFDISVDTDDAGIQRGTLDLKGPTGEAVIAIDVDLVSPPVQTPTSRRPRRPTSQEIMATAAPAGRPEGQPASLPSPQAPPASQPRQSDSPTASTPPQDANQRPSPARDLPPADSEPLKPHPRQRAVEHEPGIAEAPGAKSGQEDKTPPAAPVPREALHADGGQQGPAQESTTLERQSRAALVWAAGFVVLGVLLFVGALTHFVTGSGFKLLWQIVLVLAVVGLVITGFERPYKRLETFIHGWSFIWSICLALYLLKLISQTYTTSGEVTWFKALIWVGTVGNAILTAYGFVLLARGTRGASNVILPVTTGLIAVALLIFAINYGHNFSVGLDRGGGVVLFAAAFASILESVILLAGRARSRTDSGAQVP